MAEDISRKMLFVLVILTLLISVLGTWTVLNQINAGPTFQQAPASQSGEVHLTIQPPRESNDATGQVIFNIQKPNR